MFVACSRYWGSQSLYVVGFEDPNALAYSNTRAWPRLGIQKPVHTQKRRAAPFNLHGRSRSSRQVMSCIRAFQSRPSPANPLVSCRWQLAGWPLGTTEAETGLHTDVWVCPGVWIPNLGYTQVFEYAKAFGSPSGATYRRLDPQPRLHTGVWSPNRGYTQVFGSPTGATHGCLESQTGDCASCQKRLL